MNSKVNLNIELAHLFIETFLIKDQNPYRLVQILHYLELRGEDLHKFYIVFCFVLSAAISSVYAPRATM